MNMRRSNDCDVLVRKWEGYHRALSDGTWEVYADVAHGWNVPTIGFGTTFYSREGRTKFGRKQVMRGDRLTRKEAESELDAELDVIEGQLQHAIMAPVTQSMWDALVSFCFNLGLEGASKQILRVNARKYAEAAEAFDLYINANGRPFQGLINRRNEEQSLFRKDGLQPATNSPEFPDGSSIPGGLSYSPCPVPLPWVNDISPGYESPGDSVYWLQCALIGLGYLRKPDGNERLGNTYNEHVEYAVRLFQRQHGLLEDGIVGAQTRSALERALTHARRQPQEPDKPATGGKPVRCRFTMDLEPSQALRAGKLEFFDSANVLVASIPCTSGLAGYQSLADVWRRGAGPCPAVANQAILFSDGYLSFIPCVIIDGCSISSIKIYSYQITIFIHHWTTTITACGI